MSSKAIIYRFGSLGDTVLALPTLHALRRHFGFNNLCLLTNIPIHSKAPPMEPSVRIGKITGNRFFICVIVFLFLVQLQWAETSPVVLLETLRAILIFYVFFCFARFLGSNEYSLPRAA
jgi:hypothetical protein